MTRPIGVRLDAPQVPVAVPAPNASAEVLVAFKQALAALGKHDRYQYLHSKFVDAARSGDLETVSQLNPMLDGRDHQVLSEALRASAANGHFEVMHMIFKGREWLWSKDKFFVMGCIVEHYDPSKLAHRRAFMDLFSHVPDERRIVRGFGDAAKYEQKLTKLLADIRVKNKELFYWCRGELARPRTVSWQ
jgi:hypothetical protein